MGYRLAAHIVLVLALPKCTSCRSFEKSGQVEHCASAAKYRIQCWLHALSIQLDQSMCSVFVFNS